MEEQYNNLKKQYDLPEYSILDHEFEISTIEEESFLLREITKKLSEKIDSAIKILDDFFHPDASFASYREAELFSNQDREDMLKIYKRLMFYKRYSTELSFDDDDKKNSEFIILFSKEWSGLKSKLLTYISRSKDSWEKDISKKEVVGYLG